MNEKNSKITIGVFRKPLFPKHISGKLVLIVLMIFVVGGSVVVGGLYLKNRQKKSPEVANCKEDIGKLAEELQQKKYESLVGLADVYLQKNCPSDQKIAMNEQKGIAQMYLGKTNEAEVTLKLVEELNGGKLSVSSAQSLAGISHKNGDKKSEIKYYQALIQATKDTPDTVDDAWIPQYQTIIKNLESEL